MRWGVEIAREHNLRLTYLAGQISTCHQVNSLLDSMRSTFRDLWKFVHCAGSDVEIELRCMLETTLSVIFGWVGAFAVLGNNNSITRRATCSGGDNSQWNLVKFTKSFPIHELVFSHCASVLSFSSLKSIAIELRFWLKFTSVNAFQSGIWRRGKKISDSDSGSGSQMFEYVSENTPFMWTSL